MKGTKKNICKCRKRMPLKHRLYEDLYLHPKTLMRIGFKDLPITHMLKRKNAYDRVMPTDIM
jgi:hypothetical protein